MYQLSGYIPTVGINTIDWNERGQLYRKLALQAAEKGKPFFRLLKEAHRCELRYYQSTHVVPSVEILPSRNSCAACSKNKGKRLAIEEALRKMPIPRENCKRALFDGKPGWCRCVYLPVVNDQED